MRQETCAFVTLLFYRIFAPTETIESYGRTRPALSEGSALAPSRDRPEVFGYPGGNTAAEDSQECGQAGDPSKESASTIRRLALSEGMTSLRQDAVRKVVAGQTTPEEILRAVYLEE